MQNARSKSSFRLWLTFLKMLNWAEPVDITETFGSADLLGKGSHRAVFDVSDNNYRMICNYYFRRTSVD